jgi:hypothetical protein
VIYNSDLVLHSKSPPLTALCGVSPSGFQWQVVSCDPNDLGCNGGDLPSAYKWVLQHEGHRGK